MDATHTKTWIYTECSFQNVFYYLGIKMSIRLKNVSKTPSWEMKY